jgi:hypothetical protein
MVRSSFQWSRRRLPGTAVLPSSVPLETVVRSEGTVAKTSTVERSSGSS